MFICLFLFCRIKIFLVKNYVYYFQNIIYFLIILIMSVLFQFPYFPSLIKNLTSSFVFPYIISNNFAFDYFIFCWFTWNIALLWTRLSRLWLTQSSSELSKSFFIDVFLLWAYLPLSGSVYTKTSLLFKTVNIFHLVYV